MIDEREGTHQFEIPISMSSLFDTIIEWVHTFHCDYIISKGLSIWDASFVAKGHIFSGISWN